MFWIFPAAALAAWALLFASLALGMPSFPWAASAALAAHAIAVLSLTGPERRVRGLARARGWPAWMGAQAEKSRRKASAYVAWGVVLMVATIGSRGAWRAALASATVAYHLGAFATQGLLIATQGRLLREYESRSVSERPV